jgi:alkanesulfonate monooxygenase SsuD/methylene tetrahydromethanopterin reductase-like flavin-dependent oxidoreductase (luciferase family)
MRFGLFYEHQLPRPWGPDDEYQLLQDALVQVELADSLGIDYVWEVEHHFLEEYSHSSAPEVFLAAASQRTSTIRLGHGIIQLPHQFNHPARVAERVATLDLLSNGRVELGTGESATEAEQGGFGVGRETKREQWSDALEALSRMFVEEPFAGWDSEWLQMPVRNVVPKSRQRPHPPLWVACSRQETIHMAAAKGIGALSFSFIEPETAKQWVDDYYDTIASEACVPAGFAVNPNVAVVLPMMIHDDERTAVDRGIDGAHFFGYSLLHYVALGQHHPGATVLADEFEEKRSLFGFDRETALQEVAELGAKIGEPEKQALRGAVGTPEQVAALLRRYEAIGVDQVIFVSQAGRNQHDHICETLELFARKVMPEFAGRADEHDEAKADRLAAAVAAALARREPARVADPAYVIDSTWKGY